MADLSSVVLHPTEFPSLVLQSELEHSDSIIITLDGGDKRPVMTRYERAQAIGTRARQIGNGNPIFVDVLGMSDEVSMATKELNEGKCPLIVRRQYPDHSAESPHFDDFFIAEMRQS